MAGLQGQDCAVLLCKFNADTYVIKLLRSSSLDELVDQICSSWNISDSSSVSLRYSVPGHEKCFLRNDCELLAMFTLIDALELKFVNVSVSVSGPIECSTGVIGDGELLSGGCDNVGYISCSQGSVRFPALSADIACNASQASSSRTLLSSNWSNALTQVGQVFQGGVVEFRESLCRYSVEVGFRFVYIKNNKVKVKAVCSGKADHGCSWMVCGSFSFITEFFVLRKFVREHTCGLVFNDSGSNRLSCSNIAGLFVDHVRVNPGLKSRDIVNMFRSNYGFELPPKKALRSLDKAKGMIFGDAMQSFNFLRWYAAAATEKNPGSHFVLDVDSLSRRFRRMFVSFSASISGFKHCRPLLFIDGTFLKGRYKGVLLSATGKDGNQGLFPLAFAVVDSESLDNWIWFLTELQKILDSARLITFVSDRNPGILEAIPQVFTGHNHFYCLQHLKANLRDRFKGSSFTNTFREHVVWLFRECAYAPSQSVFFEKLRDLRRVGGSIIDRFLEGLPYHCWTNAFGEGCRYGEMTSNAAESFNAWLMEVRDLPITHMVDSIRIKLMNWFSERRRIVSSWSGVLCPKMYARYNTFVGEGRTWTVKRSSETIFEVFSVPSASVDIGMKTCTCRMWELGGFPCVHASVVINRFSCLLTDMVESYFLVVSYGKAYDGIIYPVPYAMMTEFVTGEDDMILPPSTKRPPGRPRKRRFRSAGEDVRRVRCGRCGKLGNHNKKTCKEPIQ